MSRPATPSHGPEEASAWVRRFVPLIRPGGLVLDLAAGGGRHSRLLLDRGCRVVAADRDTGALATLKGQAGERLAVIETDLETGGEWGLGEGFDGIVVTNYLHRPLLPALVSALAPGGVLIYETFAQGNERFGRPSNPDYLLRPGELLAAFAALTVVAFEQGIIEHPRSAVVQRIAAVKGAELSAISCQPSAFESVADGRCSGALPSVADCEPKGLIADG
jgi:SAM-dependent methyltransferase